jgi:hypothetical protein
LRAYISSPLLAFVFLLFLPVTKIATNFGIATRKDDEKEKREKESVFSNGSNVRIETFARVRALFSRSLRRILLSRLSFLSLSSLIFFPRDDTYRLRLFSSKNRFEFAAPKYYDFVSHNSAEGKKNRTKETETAEMYFESEKPSGASRAFCFFYSQSERKPLPSLGGEGRFF